MLLISRIIFQFLIPVRYHVFQSILFPSSNSRESNEEHIVLEIEVATVRHQNDTLICAWNISINSLAVWTVDACILLEKYLLYVHISNFRVQSFLNRLRLYRFP